MIAILSASLALAAQSPTPVACDQQEGVEIGETVYEGAVDYFPAGALEAFSCQWFSRHLESLEEPVLTSDGAFFRIRFLELPEFDYPMSITVTHYLDNTAVIEARASNGLGGFEPGKLVYQQSAALSPREVAYLAGEIASLRLCAEHPDDSPVRKMPDGRLQLEMGATRNVFEWASGDLYCLRHANARRENELTKLAIWLTRRVFTFNETPPPLRP